MQGNLRGIAYKGLNINLLKDFILPIPPYDHQVKIVEKTKELLNSIKEYEYLENRLETLNRKISGKLKNAILQAAFQGNLTERSLEDENVDDLISRMAKKRHKSINIKENETMFSFPEEWKLVSILDATDLYTGNSIPEKEKALKYTNLKEGYNYIATKDVKLNYSIDYENGIKIPYEENGFRYALPNSTLLCIEGGSAGKKIAITTQKVCFGNKLCAFYPYEILPKYLFYYLQSPLFLSAFSDSITGIIGGVSINKIKQMNIPIPSIQEQKRIVEKLDTILDCCSSLVS
jgi:type I restriction enzyme S subunit